MRISKDKSLAGWCSNMRYARKNPEKPSVKLGEKRMVSLGALGFDWRLNSTRAEYTKRAFSSIAAEQMFLFLH